MQWIGIDQLQLSPAKPRGYVPRPSHVLCRKIIEHGVIDPVVVRSLPFDRFEILSNAETWVAAGAAGLHKVPVLVRDDLTEEQAVEVVRDHYGATVTNPVDEAQAFAEQLALKGGHVRRGAITKLAVSTGHSRSYIANALRLLTLPKPVLELVRAGQLSVGQARPLVTVKGRERQLQLANTILEQKLTARAAEVLAKAPESLDGSSSRPHEKTNDDQPKSADIRKLEQAVSELTGTHFEIRGEDAVFNFYGDLNILQGILDRLGYRSH